MIPIKQRSMEIAAASQRNPSLARVLEDIYERLDAAGMGADPAPEPAPAKKPSRRAAKKK